MKNETTTYRELEQKARFDLAAKTLADPTATREHVLEARRVLESASLSTDDTAAAIRALSPSTMAKVRDMLLGDLEKRRARERAARGD